MSLLRRLFHRHHVCHRFPAFDRPGWFEMCKWPCEAARFTIGTRSERRFSRRNR